MRTVLLASLLVTHVAAAASRPHSTDPADATAEEPEQGREEEPQRTGYIQYGWQFGRDSDAIFTAQRLELGHYLGRAAFWLHGAFAYGSPTQPLNFGDPQTTASGSLTMIAGGIEARGCPSPVFCFVTAVDVGYEMATYDERTDANVMTSNSFHHDSVVAIPRIQLDLGGDRFRVRPAIEFPFGPSISGVHLSLSLALQL
jgi:hypothetical protein